MAFLDQHCPSRAVPPTAQTVTPKQQTVPPDGRICGQSQPPKPNEGVHLKIATQNISDSKAIEGTDTDQTTPPLTPVTPVTLVTPVTPVTPATGSSGEALKWASGFQPRSSTEHVRNCSQVEREVRELVVRRITDALLKTDNYINVKQLQSVRECGCEGVRGGSTQTLTAHPWNLGGRCSHE